MGAREDQFLAEFNDRQFDDLADALLAAARSFYLEPNPHVESVSVTLRVAYDNRPPTAQDWLCGRGETDA